MGHFGGEHDATFDSDVFPRRGRAEAEVMARLDAFADQDVGEGSGHATVYGTQLMNHMDAARISSLANMKFVKKKMLHTELMPGTERMTLETEPMIVEMLDYPEDVRSRFTSAGSERLPCSTIRQYAKAEPLYKRALAIEEKVADGYERRGPLFSGPSRNLMTNHGGRSAWVPLRGVGATAVRLLLAPMLLLALACSSANDSEAPPDAAQPRAPSEPELLEALGYAAWDPDADEALSGVTVHVPELTSPGFNVFTNDVDEVFLTDLAGEILHSWRLPGKKHCEDAELLEDGTLAVVCVGQALVVLKWDSSVRWQYEGPVHHDAAPLPGGNFLVPVRESARFHRGRRVVFDAVLEVTPEGEVLRRWSSSAALPALRRARSAGKLDTWPPLPELLKTGLRRLRGKKLETFNYFHLNAVEVLPETSLGARDARFRAGNLLVSLRNANTILILDREDLSVRWLWGGDVLEMQHMPTMLDTGRILVFDNGVHRGFSRVLEVDPSTSEVVWHYEARPPERFFSKWRGSNQRLPNGNTLICESERGHVFELTPGKEIVWEFWNPDLLEGKRRRIYHFMRLPPERLRHLPVGTRLAEGTRPAP